jgi:thiol-disulfide isomerase/thioredoxin
MKKNRKIGLFLFTLAIVVMVFFSLDGAQAAKLAPSDNGDQLMAAGEILPVYFFWGDGCPHCEDEKEFILKIKDDYPEIEWLSFETWNNEGNYKLMLQMTREKTGQASGVVPTIIIGDEVIYGFDEAETTGVKIKGLLDVYRLGIEVKEADKLEPEEIVRYPLIGKINLKTLSLPLLTVVLGTLDGFNPCSMWALVVLITLLINTGSRKKMWIVGGTFIVASAISYFIFLTAWLNAFLVIGYLMFVRVTIGILALGVGIYFIYDYIKKRKQDALVCEVTTSETKNKIINRLQNVLQKKSVLAMIMGVVVIAFGVNLIELMCSAGIPAIYTQILSQNELSGAGYYLYLLAYDFFYMLDDIVVLLIAGFTWQLLASTGKYTKYSHLIGGVLLLILGAIMLINPNLLMVK